MDFAAVPSSTGPLAQLAELAISAPGAASTGEWVRVRVTVQLRSGGPRMITTPETSSLLVVSGARVVARRDGAARSGAIPLTLRGGAVAPAQAVPDEVRLTSADDGAPLPPGSYSLVAVLGYQRDSFNARADGDLVAPTGARGFVLVSAPVPLEVH